MGQNVFDKLVKVWLSENKIRLNLYGFRVCPTAQDGCDPATKAEVGGGGAESRVWH